MKFKNEPQPKKAPNFRVIGGITVIYEKDQYTQFQVGTKIYKVKNNEILKAFKLAEGEVKRQRKLYAGGVPKGDNLVKKKGTLSNGRIIKR